MKKKKIQIRNKKQEQSSSLLGTQIKKITSRPGEVTEKLKRRGRNVELKEGPEIKQ